MVRMRPFAPKGLLTQAQNKQLLAWYEGENRVIYQKTIAEHIGMTPKTLRKMFQEDPERPFDNFKLKALNRFIALYNEDIQKYKELEAEKGKEKGKGTTTSLKLAEKLIDKVEG
ncbi:hypothetical protein [Enterococcus mundtii]|uniref:hypothetical protein n=1 Tax=Enterococcus mundtii TaxID=53346 RepID=UPI000DF99109|nr:hypothetical protein [Enterococcus mundtii]STE38054.1 Uncharacterised protein [Enterococcus mundtii]